jgi:antitoxin (DNA-binding transcriptional repressor) of toxin-antitoxin stability system
MENLISATELARQLGDVLGRVRYRGESFVIQRNGIVVARLLPAPPGAPGRCR